MNDSEELLEVFREEAVDLLSGLSRIMVQLESGTAGDDRTAKIREVFRLAHTLKGSAATAGRDDIAELGHALESALDALRRGEMEGRSLRPLVDASLVAVDLLQGHLVERLDPGDIVRVAAALNAVRLGNAEAPAHAPAPTPAAVAPAVPATRDALLGELFGRLARVGRGDGGPDLQAAQGLASRLISLGGTPELVRVAQALEQVLKSGGPTGQIAEPALNAALMALDFLTQAGEGLGGSPEEVTAIESAVRAAQPIPAVPKERLAPIQRPGESRLPDRRPVSDGPAPAPPPPQQDASVRIPISLLDSILYRLDELVAVKLRLDYQRRQIEEAQETLDGSFSMSRGSAGGASGIEVEGHKRRLELIRRDLAQEVHFLGILAQELQEDVKEVRMVPLGPVLEPFRRVVRDLASSLGKEVSLELEGEAVRVDKRLLDLIRDPLMHLLRNSVDHGIEQPAERVAAGKPPRAQIRISAESRESQVWLDINDDGRGISVDRIKAVALERGLVERDRLNAMTDREALNLIFAPGFSTAKSVTELSGRGVGLDVVRENVGRLGGRIEFYTELGRGTQFTLCLPLTLAASRGLLVVAGQDTYCLPLSAVEEVISVEPQDLGVAQGHFVVNWGRQATSFLRLEDLLAGRISTRPRNRVFAVILALSDRRAAIGVDDLLGQEEVVVKGLRAGTPRLAFVAGATSLADGKLVTVLEPGALMEAAAAATSRGVAVTRTSRQATILVADDSLTTRTMIASVLDRAGYRTLLAHDGAFAATLLAQQAVDLVVSDVEMPNLDGFGLVRYLRSSPQHHAVPAILVTSLNAPEDRARGAEVGATAYIVKREFDPGAFLSLVTECLGQGGT